MSTEKILVNEARDKMAQARKEISLTQTELARKLGKNRLWVQNREIGRLDLYLDDLVTFTKATGKPLAWFFQEYNYQSDAEWKARYDSLIKEVEKLCSAVVKRHHSKMSDNEIVEEMQQLGITDDRLQEICRKWEKFSEEKKLRVATMALE